MTRGRAAGVAVLGMYDRPELRAETDALWVMLREAIRDRGIDAPETLERHRPMQAVWGSPDLVLGQTCGLPYVKRLADRVGLIGAPAHALAECPPGWYRSVLIVARDCPAESLGALGGARPAINAWNSQSGYGALMHAAAGHAVGGRFFGAPVLTGGHAASIAAVAAGGADLAAIDAVTWALALGRDPASAMVRVLGRTDPTPGLPYIAARGRDPAILAAATDAAIAALPEAVRARLMLTGFVRFSPADYDMIAARLVAAETAHRLPPACAARSVPGQG